jgi:hypothetical protein
MIMIFMTMSGTDIFLKLFLLIMSINTTKEGIMSIALIGGMERLGRQYRDEAESLGIRLQVYNEAGTGLAGRLAGVDAVVIFTNKVSHRAKRKAVNIARARNIPLVMSHSCGVCTLRQCFNCIKDKKGAKENG